MLGKRQLVGHSEVDRQGLYKCSTLEKFKVLCGKANGMRQRTIHNLGNDVSLGDTLSFAHPELYPTNLLLLVPSSRRPRTPACHAGNTGSNPVGTAIK